MKKTAFIFKSFAILFALLIIGCSPLSNEATVELFKSLRERSSCVLIGGGAGGGAITVPSPTIPITGGYGYAWIAHAMPEHSVEIDKEGCRITAAQRGAVIGAGVFTSRP